MKKYLSALCLLFFAAAMTAQTETNKFGITAGFGFQQYQGNVGNGFYNFKTSSYGVGTLHLTYYLSKSFDAGLIGTLGDYGYCQASSVANTEVPVIDRCKGCGDRVGLGNLNSRLYSAGFMVKYKFANGYLLKEDARFKPFVYGGACYNSIQDIMKMQCISPGTYYSVNAGLGIRYDLNKRINVSYNLGFGYFVSAEHPDGMEHGANDTYLQNSVCVGISLF